MENERKNQEYQLMFEQIKNQHIQEIQDIYKTHNLEKQALENTIFSLQNEINNKEADNSGFYKREITKLNKNINELKKNHAEEVI